MESPYQLSEPFVLSELFSSNDENSFTRRIEISPDGSQLLSTHENSHFSIVQIPTNLIQSNSFYRSTETIQCPISQGSLESTPPLNDTSIFAGESILDSQWYPFMNESSPITCCFLSTTRDHPIHLWDSVHRSIRCSYIGHNHLDELDTAYSVTFNKSGDKIFSGSNRMIRMFDVNYSGKNYTNYPTSKTKKHSQGQKGIISTLSFNPDYSKTFAAGTFSSSVGIYSEEDVSQGSLLELRDLSIGGVTCMRWSPCGRYLWVGGRHCDDVVCWDLRQVRERH